MFGIEPAAITMEDVNMAIASFERTLVAGDSPFDRWYFGGDKTAISDAAVRGFEVFLEDGRCVSCHTIEQDHALFTDNRFHNIGVGINRIQEKVPEIAPKFLEAKAKAWTSTRRCCPIRTSSELGRFAVTDSLDELGSFKTPTLRNIASPRRTCTTAACKTLRDVVEHYNNGGVTNKDDPVNDFLSGGIRELNLTEQQIADLVAFMEALTSPQHVTRRSAGAHAMSTTTPDAAS